MRHPSWKVASLLFCSGFCALIYQTVWLRQFRLIFGASTFATGAVLALFMAGLGVGSAVLGKRADAKERPLAFYGYLELFIAAAAALSPLLLWVAAKLYFASGGSPDLGIAVATILRLVLAFMVLGPATFLMGGTLPAAARAVETDDDSGRRGVALLYGVNTLGAVAGALLSTFVMLETFGNRKTLFVAVLVNVIVAVVARSMGRVAPGSSRPEDVEETGALWKPAVPHRPVYIASALVGFAFLLMELVWYRMLSPVLGGTTYMFGLILAIALLGIGLGGAAYSVFRRRPATPGGFAITCSLEALAIAVPFALGDRLAILANVLRELGALSGFGGHVLAWTIVTAIVVFPAAFIAGIQFPLLIGLLGRGRENVGRQIGGAYAWNTGGAIAGSLAGGFGLIPLLSAPGTWRLVAILLAILAFAAMLFAAQARQLAFAGATIVIAVAAIVSTFAVGPTAVWRHSGIGAARAPKPKTRNELLEFIHSTRRSIVWERDGRESSVAIAAQDDTAFVVNGKRDGAARHDAGTQIMVGLLGGIFHPQPKTALVVGLGTGSTAGWLAAIPSIERVDAIELEPVVLDVARMCEPVSADAMKNPAVHITIADAREVLLTTDKKYDIISSEPSNPYRAGIASLFTREFYEASAGRLNKGGYLLQWVQAYQIHASTMQTIYGTVASVFPHVLTWWTSPGDLVLVASREPIVIDVEQLRRRIDEEPFRSGLHHSWRVDSAESFVARLAANEDFAKAAAKEATTINTDDRTVIEFGFARSIDAAATVLGQITITAQNMRMNVPVGLRGTLDWNEVNANRMWNQVRAPAENAPNLGVMSLKTLELAKNGDSRAEALAEKIRQREPLEADVIVAMLRSRQNRQDEAAMLLRRAMLGYRTNPWPEPEVMFSGVELAMTVAQGNPQRARLLHDALSQPFAVLLQENYRRQVLVDLASSIERCGPQTIAALRAVEPFPFWYRHLLQLRAECYARNDLQELAARALRDLELYDANMPAPIITSQSPQAPPGSS